MENPQKFFRKVAVDIDDVLIDFQGPFLDFFNQRNGTDFAFKSISSYDFPKVFNVSRESFVKEIVDFYQSPHFRGMSPIPETIEAITRLRKRNFLYSITSRPDLVFEETKGMLQRYFRDSFLRIHFTNQFLGNGLKERKSDLCFRHGYELIIEDSAEHANECAEMGIEAFIFTKPWNENEALHPRAKRIEDWKEVLLHLE